MIIRPGDKRGHADHGWLRSYHTFSFADYYDPEHMGFRALRVINEDRVEGGNGFGAHSHRDMEILSYVLDGELAHRDSMGNGAVIRPGEVQRMSAGTGVVHSEFNNSPDKLVHFLQIWILPERRGIRPSYQQKAFPLAERQGRWRLLASRDGRDGSVSVHQDVSLYSGVFEAGQGAHYQVPSQRYVWLHAARGRIRLNGESLKAGDAAAFEPSEAIELTGEDTAEVLLFDLA
jgi:redox-sensitive bicupin YhaK (pirin superfamily)